MTERNARTLAEKATYNLGELAPTGEQVLDLYPVLAKCQGCNNCTKSCQQDLEVMGYISNALCGNIVEVANKSFNCVMCGLCAARCPAEIPPHNIALLCRRLYSRYLVPSAQHLANRVAEIEEGKFDAEFAELKKMGESELRHRCSERGIEPQSSNGGYQDVSA